MGTFQSRQRLGEAGATTRARKPNSEDQGEGGAGAARRWSRMRMPTRSSNQESNQAAGSVNKQAKQHGAEGCGQSP